MCDASGGAFTISLPNTGSAGYRFTIKKIDASANAVTVSAPIGIDGVPTLVLTDQWEWVEVVSTFTTGQYMIVGRG
ncbi:hypothetical protein [Gordonia westfalica]|nr:hypothetical protein [Gordonia westfalica]SDT84418.1 hypothetical protein SAMN04488548_10845 [Gordonia westfalica]